MSRWKLPTEPGAVQPSFANLHAFVVYESASDRDEEPYTTEQTEM